MNLFLTLCFLFAIGSSFGWILELLFRRLFTAKKWINPGFLVGPCLPLYGFGLCTLYLLSSIELSFLENEALQAAFRVLLIGLALTAIEYIAGKIFILGMKVKLWDYSDRKGNIEGIICPLFSLFWTVLGGLYSLLLHPPIARLVADFLTHPFIFFFLGIFFGILLVDFSYSARLLAKIRAFAKENHLVVRLEEFKSNLQEKIEKNKFFHFVFALHDSHPIRENLKEYAERLSERARSFAGRKNKKQKG